MVDIDIIAGLRRQLEEARGRQAILEARIVELEGLLQRRAEQLGEEPDAKAREAQGSRFWYSAWSNARHNAAQLNLRIIKLERWTKEHGEEAARLQTALDVARNEIGQLTRQLDLARAGERSC